jgi:sorting nexin-4
MHQHVAHPPSQEASAGIIDNLSDTLLNAFSKVRKPDERFLAMREDADKFEEGTTTSDRLYNRIRNRTSGECDNLTLEFRPLNLRLIEMAIPNLAKI